MRALNLRVDALSQPETAAGGRTAAGWTTDAKRRRASRGWQPETALSHQALVEAQAQAAAKAALTAAHAGSDCRWRCPVLSARKFEPP
jgi:hypothetical protein